MLLGNKEINIKLNQKNDNQTQIKVKNQRKKLNFNYKHETVLKINQIKLVIVFSMVIHYIHLNTTI